MRRADARPALWAFFHLPALPLEVYARAISPATASTPPFAVGSGGRTPSIVAADAAAIAAGIRPRQLVSAALALAPDLALRDRDPALEAAALANVATWASQFTPALVLEADGVLAELGGSAALFGGVESLASRLAQGIAELGYTARIALAPTPLAATALARAGRTLRDGQSPDAALAPLALAHFGVDAATIAMLAASGVTTFGAACALPRAGLARRAGPGFVAMQDRARGAIADPREPFVPPQRYEGRLELPAAVENVEALAFALSRLVRELAGWLSGRGLGITKLALHLAHERRPVGHDAAARTDVSFALAAPARDAAHLCAVLRERLARIVLPAPVVGLTLASEATEPLPGRNLGFLPEDAAAAAIVPLVDRLRARLGDDAVTLVVPHAEHRPERAWRAVAVTDDRGASGDKRAPVRSSRAAPDPAAASPEIAAHSGGLAHRVKRGRGTTIPQPSPALPPRPVWLLSEPAPLAATLGEAPWVLRDGPERIESGWWDGADVRRDYFVAESAKGELMWIYRDHRRGIDDGEWYLHGVFA